MSALAHTRARTRSSSRHAKLAAGCALLAAALVLIAVASSPSSSRADTEAQAAARSFLGRYVDPDGRVVRRDQGGDTVSEGQSYGLLLAQVAGDDATFGRVWRWTRTHLQRHDALFAYLDDGSRVKSSTPASDADLLMAWALLRAGGPHAGTYHADGRRIASAVLQHETATRGGRLMLAAGPWATGSPVTLDPSYWALPAFQGLGAKVGGSGFGRLASDSIAITREITAGGRSLPPDWARVDGSLARPTPAPGGQAPSVQYGLDAQRLVVWLASSCDPAARKLAAHWWPILSQPGRAGAIALGARGIVKNGATGPLPLVAAAASAGAEGRPTDRDHLLDQATAADQAHPTYYGAAWVALGRALLTTRLLDGCSQGGSS